MAPNDGHPKVSHPSDPEKFYVYPQYCEWAYGPFDTAAAAGEFIRSMVAENSYAFYDGVSIMNGIEDRSKWPTPLDYGTFVSPYLHAPA